MDMLTLILNKTIWYDKCLKNLENQEFIQNKLVSL